MKADTETRAFKLKDIDAAMQRAALRARQIAKRTGTPLVVGEDGRIVHVEVTDEEIASFEKKISGK